MTFPVFDLHCDTAYALLGKSLRECGNLRKNNGHVDLERTRQLLGYAQCFACFTSTIDPKIPAVELFERELATVLREIEKNSDIISLAYSAEDVEKNYKCGKQSAILTIEGPAGFDFDHGLLQDLYLVGFRMTTLCWNEKNPLTGTHITGGGLTAQGREFVKTAQKMGMIVDLSHISDDGFWDVIDITDLPVIASHSNSRTICNHSRNLTDEMFRAICGTGGVAGINLYSEFLGSNADLDAVCDHIFHFLDLDPDGLHISLGGDLDGCDRLPEGFSGVQDYNCLSDRLLERGLDAETVMNIFWNNALGVMKRCCT